MTNYAPPSRNPVGNKKLSSLLASHKRKLLLEIEGMLPAQVIAYDDGSNNAQVKILIDGITTANERVARAQIASVPVLRIGGGGYFIYFPIKSGDLGWIKSNDRDISLFKQSAAQSPPNTFRMHKFSDGLFIPDTALSAITLGNPSAFVIGSADGMTQITMAGGVITFTAPTGIVFDAPSITTTGDTQFNGIDFATHRHTGVQSGTSDTGGPI